MGSRLFCDNKYCCRQRSCVCRWSIWIVVFGWETRGKLPPTSWSNYIVNGWPLAMPIFWTWIKSKSSSWISRRAIYNAGMSWPLVWRSCRRWMAVSRWTWRSRLWRNIPIGSCRHRSMTWKNRRCNPIPNYKCCGRKTRSPVRRSLSTGQAGCRSSSWAIVMPTNWASVLTDCPWVFPFLCLPIARKWR